MAALATLVFGFVMPVEKRSHDETSLKADLMELCSKCLVFAKYGYIELRLGLKLEYGRSLASQQVYFKFKA